MPESINGRGSLFATMARPHMLDLYASWSEPASEVKLPVARRLGRDRGKMLEMIDLATEGCRGIIGLMRESSRS